jgi:hypothetical protein
VSDCLVASADVTEVFNEQVHILASGIDDQGNYLEPLHIEDAREESLTIVPHDPSLPTFTGHREAVQMLRRAGRVRERDKVSGSR